MSYPPISSEQLPTTSTTTNSNNTATTAPSTTATQSIGSSSASPQPPSSTTAPNIPTIHKRTYQACIPCRQRKVRCDLGSVEAPHSPPCVRCRRESKDCFFSATRRKTRTNSTTVIPRGGSKAVGTVGRGGGFLGSGYVAKREYMDDGSTIYDPVDDGDGESVSTGSMLSRGGVRKKQKVGGEEDDDLFGADTAYRLPPPIIEPPLRHGSQHRSTHVPPPPQSQTHHNQQAASVSRERLLQGEVYNSHDALHLLYEAAGRGASGPSSPKPKSDSGENDEDEDEQDDDDGEDDDHDNDHVMGEAQTNDAMRSTMVATTNPTNRATEIGNSYPTKYDDVDGRASSINPISHFNGSISTSTSFLRGTGRPGTAKPAPPQEITQAATKVNNPPAVTPTSPISTRSGNTQQSAQLTGIRNRTSFSQRSAASEKSSIHGEDREGLQAALKAWGKSRFVKSGWFTAREAIKYVDYFFEHHHPLSPLLTTSYAQHSTHPTLLQHEPFLATTLLAIASRYVHLPGPGGHSRSYAIHDMLWRELRRGLESVIWGGGGGGPPSRGGLAGLGNSPGKGLRTLGTVEALMVLTEWHVRNLHFPVGGEGGWGAFDGVFGNENDEEEGEGGSGSSIGETFPHRRHHHRGSIAGRRARERHRGVVEGLGDRIENILEPAWRSDRMSWMLLGNALTLSYELGVFDDLDEPISSVSTPQSVATPSSTSHAQHQTANSITGHSVPHVAPQTAYRLRCRRIQKLLVVYVTQLASRLGWTSMIPKNITDSLGYKGQFSGSQSHLFAAAGAVAFPYNLSKPDSRPGTGGATSVMNGTHTSAPGSTTSPKTTNIPVNGSGIPIIPRTPTELQDTVFQCWVDLTMLMKYCGEQCFPSRVGTRDLMRSGKYVSVLETLRPILRGWKEGFEAFGFPTPIHNILTLEYEHVRMYINSLALQAIIDRCTTTSVQPPLPQPAAGKDAKQRKSSSSHSTSEQPSFAVLMKTNPTDLDFVTEVVDASRCVLTTVVERMASTGELKHAPVRIYLRILSAAMFLLKTFALGAKEDDITVSLELMDQTVEVLRRESCDDVHLGLRFGELLETLTKKVRMRFVRMQGGSRADSPTPMEGGNGNGHAKGIGERGLMGVNRGLQSAVANGEANAAEELTGYGNGTNGASITGGADFGEQQGAAKGEENSDELAGSSSNNNSHLLAPSSTPSSGMLMPPPPHPAVFPYFDPSDPTATNPSYFNPAGFEDWLALPIDPIMGWSGSSGSEHTFLGGVMGSSTGSGGGSGGSGHGGSGGGAGSSGGGGRSGYGGGSSVTQTQMGPDVGGYDLLELLLGSDQAGGGGAGMGDL